MIWRAIPGFEGYEVSRDTGEVRRIGETEPLKQNDVNGYRFVSLRGYGSKAVHRLVVMAFIGPIPKGMHVNHKNRKKDDNRRRNLEIVTQRQNTRHMFGLTHHRLKYTIALHPASRLIGVAHNTLHHLAYEGSVPARIVRQSFGRGNSSALISFRPDHLMIIKEWKANNPHPHNNWARRMVHSGLRFPK